MSAGSVQNRVYQGLSDDLYNIIVNGGSTVNEPTLNMALNTAVPKPSRRPQTVAIRSTPGMKTIPSEAGSAIDSSADVTPAPIATTTSAARIPSPVEGDFALSRNIRAA